jgi:putative transposase
LKSSGALDDIFARIDAGEPLSGQAGLLTGMVKASLEWGLEAVLTEHVGATAATLTPACSRARVSARSRRRVTSEVGDIERAIPRDCDGTDASPLVPKGARRLDAECPSRALRPSVRRSDAGSYSI